MEKPHKILFFKVGAMGDVLMTTPLVRQVRKLFPDAEIVYYVGQYAASMLAGNKNIDRVELFDQDIFYKKKIFSAMSLRTKIKNEKFDMAFVLDKHWSFGLFMKLCGVPVRVGLNRNGEGKYHTHSIVYQQAQHEILYYVSLLQAIGLNPGNDTKIDFELSKEEKAFADDFFKQHGLRGKVIGILAGEIKNPGETAQIRRWQVDKYMELAQRLGKTNKVVLIGSTKDSRNFDQMIDFMKNKNVVNGSQDRIRNSAALISKCDVVVCSDCGPMHIASGLGKRIVSIFGPTNPRRKAPLNKGCISIWDDQDIYEESYELRGKLPDASKNGKWMQMVTVNEVLNAVKKLL